MGRGTCTRYFLFLTSAVAKYILVLVDALCVGGANVRYVVDVLEIIRQSSAHFLRLSMLDKLR